MAETKRVAELTRTTKETDIALSLNIDGTGVSSIDTGVPFFDHMLEAFGRHGYRAATCLCKSQRKKALIGQIFFRCKLSPYRKGISPSTFDL